MEKWEEQWNRLREQVRTLQDAVVAFSGGVDSSLVLKACQEELGEHTLAITAVSPSYPQYELENAQAIARHIGAAHVIVRGSEMQDARYQRNNNQRCYFCKSNLYMQLQQEAAARGFRNIVNGINRDDLFDFRPGLKAADELSVRSPLKEAGLGKKEIIELAHELGLPNWNKPASPCLSSRVPYGIAITPEILGKIERAENVLRACGLQQFRVRYHKEIARIEVMPEEFELVLRNAAKISERIKAVGFRYVALDLGGFKSGNLNRGMGNGQMVQRAGI